MCAWSPGAASRRRITPSTVIVPEKTVSACGRETRRRDEREVPREPAAALRHGPGRVAFSEDARADPDPEAVRGTGTVRLRRVNRLHRDGRFGRRCVEPCGP